MVSRTRGRSRPGRFQQARQNWPSFFAPIRSSYPACLKLSWQIRWIGSTTLGLALVGFGLHFPGSSEIGSGIDAWQPGAGAFGAILGAISGVIVGLLQWLALRRALGGPWAVVAVMAVGIGFTHAVGDGAPTSLDRGLVALASGLVLTGALAFALAERRPLRLSASVVGWAGGLLLGYVFTGALGLPATQDPVGWGTEHAVVGTVTGLVWGSLTAAMGSPMASRMGLRQAAEV